MKQEIKDFILNTLNVGRDYSEDGNTEYVGRGMYSLGTHAVITEDAYDIEVAVIDFVEDAEDEQEAVETLINVGLIYTADSSCDSIELECKDYQLAVKVDSFHSNYVLY